MTKVEWIWAILALLVAVFIALLPSIGYSTDAYKLYIYNKDKENYYLVRIINEETRWVASINIEADSCEVVYRMEPGEHSIRTYKDGKSLGDYMSFDITDDDLCIEITSVTGGLEFCSNTFCD